MHLRLELADIARHAHVARPVLDRVDALGIEIAALEVARTPDIDAQLARAAAQAHVAGPGEARHRTLQAQVVGLEVARAAHLGRQFLANSCHLHVAGAGHGEIERIRTHPAQVEVAAAVAVDHEIAHLAAGAHVARTARAQAEAWTGDTFEFDVAAAAGIQAAQAGGADAHGDAFFLLAEVELHIPARLLPHDQLAVVHRGFDVGQARWRARHFQARRTIADDHAKRTGQFDRIEGGHGAPFGGDGAALVLGAGGLQEGEAGAQGDGGEHSVLELAIHGFLVVFVTKTSLR